MPTDDGMTVSSSIPNWMRSAAKSCGFVIFIRQLRFEFGFSLNAETNRPVGPKSWPVPMLAFRLNHLGDFSRQNRRRDAPVFRVVVCARGVDRVQADVEDVPAR